MLEFIFFKLSAICLGLELFSFSFVLKRITNNNHNPGSLYSLYWAVIILIPNIILYDVPINPLPLIYILASAVIFSIGSLAIDWKLVDSGPNFAKTRLIHSLDSRFFRIIFFVSFILGILFPILMLVQNGFSLELLFLDWVATSSSYATNRSLNDAYEYGIVGQLSTFFPIFVSAVGGVLSSSFCSFKKKCLYFFLSMFPAILFMISHSSKIIFLYSLFFYGAVFISFKIFKGHKISISKRIMKLAFTIGLLILPIILFSFTLREGSNEGLSFALLPTIFSYAYGSIFAFSDFFLFYVGIDSQSNYIVEGTFTLGYYSFKSVFDLFGGTKVFPPGYYFDFYNYNDYIQTNIFTLFRQLIQDFGVIGSLIFVFIVGTIVNVSYVFIFKINYPYFFICLLVLFFVFLGMSYMFSIFTSRSSVLVVVVLYSVLKLNSLMLNKPRDLKIFFKN